MQCSFGGFQRDVTGETIGDDHIDLAGGNVVAFHESLKVDGMSIEAVPSYNRDKDFHPQKNGWLGFIVETEGIKIYHAGDTDFIPEMKDFEVDIALIPVSGTYVMTAEQGVKAALAINPKLAIPMHYGAIVGGDEDAVQFKNDLDGKIDVLVLPKGG